LDQVCSASGGSMRRYTSLGVLCSWLLGFGGLASVPAAQAAPRVPGFIKTAVADSARPDEDRQRDTTRKPAETLAFAGIKPGDTVIELLPGKGYFTRILSKVVGPRGHVFALSPPRRPSAPADAPDPVAATQALAQESQYSNITAQGGPLNTVHAPTAADVVFTAQNYHDLHNIPSLDVAAFNKSVFEALKPGGRYIVLDHAAANGSGSRDTATLHRIDVATVKAEVTAAGFKFVADSDLLRNPGDDHSAKVFDPSVRGHTDQFILKFRKPGGSGH
jgi:predicted methyltransferase